MTNKRKSAKTSRRKPVEELTDAQALRRLFPKEVRDEVRRVAKDSDKQASKRQKPE